MPTVHVNMWSGVSEGAAAKIIAGITDVFKGLDIPESAVEVIIHEVPKTHWGIGGTPTSKSMPDGNPP